MADKLIENNQAQVIGTVASGFTFSHEVFGESFYMMYVECRRTSGTNDTVPVQVSDRLVDVERDYTGEAVCVTGQFRSYNSHEGTRNRLLLYLFARDIEFQADAEDGNGWDGTKNEVFLEGAICKEPVYRKTPLGREIADLLLAVNRPYGKSDYIPIIVWGRNARFAGSLQVGDEISMKGRIQSREYLKKISEDETERRTAYEVSCSRMERAIPEEWREDE